jgi:hypothetical protein
MGQSDLVGSVVRDWYWMAPCCTTIQGIWNAPVALAGFCYMYRLYWVSGNDFVAALLEREF